MGGRPLGPSLASPLRAGLTSSRALEVLPQQVWHISQDGDFTASLDKPVPILFGYSLKKKNLVIPNLNLPCISFCLLLLLLPPCASEELGSVFSAPSPWLLSFNRRSDVGEGESTETKANFSLQQLKYLTENLTFRKWHLEICTAHLPPFSSFQWSF